MKLFRFKAHAGDFISENGITQAELADSIQYSRAGMNHALRRGKHLRYTTAVKIAKVFAAKTETMQQVAFNQLFDEVV